MSKIDNLNFSYLCGAVAAYDAGVNDFTGSLFLKEHKHGAFENTFNYKLHLCAKDGKKEKIIASYYVGIMNFENTDESEITAKDFEASQQGTDEAVNWLQSEYEKLKK